MGPLCCLPLPAPWLSAGAGPRLWLFRGHNHKYTNILTAIEVTLGAAIRKKKKSWRKARHITGPSQRPPTLTSSHFIPQTFISTAQLPRKSHGSISKKKKAHALLHLLICSPQTSHRNCKQRRKVY